MMLLFLASELLGVPGWAWLLVGCAACAAAGFWWGSRRATPESTDLDAVWSAVGRPEFEDRPAADGEWPALLAEVERHRDLARSAQRLQLETNAIEEERELLGDVLNALQDGVLVIERGERVLYANPTARRVVGLEGQQNPTLDQAHARFEIVDGIRSVLGADLARTVKSSQVHWDDGAQRRTFVVRCLVPAERSLSRSESDNIVVLEDMTAEEKSSRAKTEFIYGVSHELKTPLTSIQASLEMLAEDEGLAEEDRKKLLDLSLSESQRLTRMVLELLDLARVEAGITEFKHDKVLVDGVLQDLHALHRPLADRESITLSWDVSEYLPVLFGDSRLLRQAFVNLVGNAVKYTKSGGDVALTARLEGDELVVRIRDTGIGIAAEDVSRIFDKFFRAGSAEKSKIQGTGLGLPMARYIIERHQGRIEVTSEIDVGTEFSVFLPVGSTDPDSQGVESTFAAVDGMQ